MLVAEGLECRDHRRETKAVLCEPGWRGGVSRGTERVCDLQPQQRQ